MDDESTVTVLAPSGGGMIELARQPSALKLVLVISCARQVSRIVSSGYLVLSRSFVRAGGAMASGVKILMLYNRHFFLHACLLMK